MKKITVDKVTVEVRRTTIRARMHSTALNATSLTLIDEIVEEMSVSEVAIVYALADFVTMAPRVKVVKGKMDFEFPVHNETSETFKSKFYAYLDSDFVTLIDEIVKTMNELDRVQNENLLPGVVLADNEKKS